MTGFAMIDSTQSSQLRVAIIGAGMSGILAAIKLREDGWQHVVIYEKAARIGGTWRDNSYPGLSCDVPAHAYTYSFAPNAEWSRHMAPGPEIQAYFERMVQQHDLAPCIRFNTEVTACEWRGGAWHLATSDGALQEADVVIAATGVLHHPKYPQIPGLHSFAGQCFHSARWDHGAEIEGQRVGVIGNGSTGAQLISALAGRAAHLSHFQRTAQWILPVENPVFTEAQKQALRDDPVLLKQAQASESYLAIVDHFTRAVIDAESPELAHLQQAVEENLERSIANPVLREKLRPPYRAACKRLIVSPDYYQAIQHPQVALLNEGIECVEPEGIRTRDGVLHPLDVLVLATGFHADRFVRDMNVVGQSGLKLNEVWAERPFAYLAMSVPGFPNFFMLNGPSGPVGNFSLIDVAEAQWNYIAQLLQPLRQGRYQQISVAQAAMNDYETARIAAARKTVWATGCNSWYLDAQGVPATWPWSYAHFREVMTTPNLAHFDCA